MLLHQKVAGCLEEIYRGNERTIINKLAYHYSHTTVSKKTMRYTIFMAKTCCKKYSWHEAISWIKDLLKTINNMIEKNQEFKDICLNYIIVYKSIELLLWQ